MNEILQHMASNGFYPKEIIPDGEIHRFNRDKNDKKKSAWYICYDNISTIVCEYADWHDDKKFKYIHGTDEIDQKKFLKKISEKAKQAEKVFNESDIIKYWNLLYESNNSEYCKRKGIKKLYGARTTSEGVLVIPVKNSKDEICGFQKIYESGNKKFKTGSKIKGNFFELETGKNPGEIIYIAEGYATACAIHMATTEHCVVAFSASNIDSVCQFLRKKYTNKTIIICADNDGNGVGKRCAESAATKHNCKITIPEQVGYDFNDVFLECGAEKTKELIAQWIIQDSLFFQKSSKIGSPYYICTKAFLSRLKKHYNNGIFTSQENVKVWVCARNCIWETLDDFALKSYLTNEAAKDEIHDYVSTNEKTEAISRLKELTRSDSEEFETKQREYSHIIAFNKNFINIKTGEILKPDPDYCRTTYIPININKSDNMEDYSCPIWLKTINDIYEGDESRIKLLQEIFGYNFLSDSRFDKFVCLIGPGGNGKSVILSIMKACLNGTLRGFRNTSALELSRLNDSHSAVMLENKMANISSESARSLFNAIQNIKAISAGDSITINPKFKPAYSAEITCKLITSINETPSFGEDNDALKQRAIIIPHNKKIRGTDMDIKDLESKIIQAGELKSIIFWALEGLKRLMENQRFTESEAVENCYKDMQRENDPVRRFCEENFVFSDDPDDFVSKQFVIEQWNEWKFENGLDKTPTKFMKRIMKMFDGKCYETKRTPHSDIKRKWCIAKLRVKNDVDYLNETTKK